MTSTVATCPYCGEYDFPEHRCYGKHRLVLRAVAAAVAGASLGALGALLIIDQMNAAFIGVGAVLGAVLVVGVWQAAWMRPLR